MRTNEFIETDDYFILHFEDITILLKRRSGDTSYLRNERTIATNNTTMTNKAFTVGQLDYKWNGFLSILAVLHERQPISI